MGLATERRRIPRNAAGAATEKSNIVHPCKRHDDDGGHDRYVRFARLLLLRVAVILAARVLPTQTNCPPTAKRTRGTGVEIVAALRRVKPDEYGAPRCFSQSIET